jgi:hypothetical protein
VNIADRIVAVLLDGAGNVHFDVHQRPDLYEPTGKTNKDGLKVVRVCTNCEAAYGSDKQYPDDVSMSHGMCRQHAIQQLMQHVGFSREEAEAKVDSLGSKPCPNWQQVLGLTTLDSPNPSQGKWTGGGFPGSPAAGDWPKPPAKACTMPKATFWATSGSGGV